MVLLVVAPEEGTVEQDVLTEGSKGYNLAKKFHPIIMIKKAITISKHP